jgi:hypothetical protein
MIMQKFILQEGHISQALEKKKINIGSIKTTQGTKTRVGFLAGFLDM